MNIKTRLSGYVETSLVGRYITNENISPLIEKHHEFLTISSVGKSVLGNDIQSFQLGTGKTKILIWSQMHGNESTCTKAIFDFLNFWRGEMALKLRQQVTICIVPILNPDGAIAYTRENANGVDINRDFVVLSQPETNFLMAIYNDFKPDYCFNMHDQRTIFGLDNAMEPATVSFLAPSFNANLDVNANRLKAMMLIAAMNEALQKFIPGKVGRFDDAFNINCAGDMLQSLGTSTILFEAGHYPADYQREITRHSILLALVSGIEYIANDDVGLQRIEDYLNIPQNKIVFYDFVYRNVKINYDNNEIITNFATHYREELVNDDIIFTSYICEIGELSNYRGHVEYDAAFQKYTDNFSNRPQSGQKGDFFLGNEKFVNGSRSQ